MFYIWQMLSIAVPAVFLFLSCFWFSYVMRCDLLNDPGFEVSILESTAQAETEFFLGNATLGKLSSVFIPHDCIGQFPSLKSEALWCTLVIQIYMLQTFPLITSNSPRASRFLHFICPQTLTHPLLFSPHRRQSLAKFTKSIRACLLPRQWGWSHKSEVSLSQHVNSPRHPEKLSLSH